VLPGAVPSPDGWAPREPAAYRPLGEVTTGRAATDLASHLDGLAERDLRHHCQTMEATGAHLTNAARVAERAALRAAQVASEAAVVDGALGRSDLADPARSTVEVTDQAISRLAEGAIRNARRSARAALATTIATRLAELAVIDYEYSRRRGTEGPNAPRSNAL